MREMNDWENSRERHQKIALCAQTYFNLYGVMPDVSVLVKWLGESYLGEIVQYLRMLPKVPAYCA